MQHMYCVRMDRLMQAEVCKNSRSVCTSVRINVKKGDIKTVFAHAKISQLSTHSEHWPYISVLFYEWYMQLMTWVKI